MQEPYSNFLVFFIAKTFLRMTLDIFKTVDIIEIMENFTEERRPPIEIRDELDLSYKIENQSIIIFEIRPKFKSVTEKIECLIAKTTFVKTNNSWKVFWQRADLKWHLYKPQPVVKTLKDFTQLVNDDIYHCFWG